MSTEVGALSDPGESVPANRARHRAATVRERLPRRNCEIPRSVKHPTKVLDNFSSSGAEDRLGAPGPGHVAFPSRDRKGVVAGHRNAHSLTGTTYRSADSPRGLPAETAGSSTCSLARRSAV